MLEPTLLSGATPNILSPERLNAVLPILIQSAGRILVAILLWTVGRSLVFGAVTLVRKALNLRAIELTVTNYLCSALAVVLNIALVVALLGYFGIETTSFAALFAAAGVAIGAAWSGLLAHFAAGIFLLIFRPFKVGDGICAAGVTGVVREIGLFSTSIETADAVHIVVGNNKMFSENIINYSHNPVRWATVSVEIDGSHDYQAVMALLLDAARAVPKIVQDPAPVVDFGGLKAGPVLAVSVACHQDNFISVSGTLARQIFDVLKANRIGPPVPCVRHLT